LTFYAESERSDGTAIRTDRDSAFFGPRR